MVKQTTGSFSRTRTITVKRELKVLIVINTDLRMTTGKIISQACHATSEVILKTERDTLEAWLRDGQPKIIVKANRLQMINMVNECISRRLPIHFVYDAGRTQVLPGANTVIAIGPESKEVIDEVTGGLKLF